MHEELKHLYIHVPFCDGKCLYCGFFSEFFDSEAAEKYLACLEIEMDLYLAGKPAPAPETIYIGGGTPSVLSTSQLERLITLISSRVDTSALREWTIESNPGTFSSDKADMLASNSVNRISIGAQSFCDSTLRQMRRRHNSGDIGACVNIARSAGFSNIGLDLIAGFPGVSDEEWKNSIENAISLNPSHISVYALSQEEDSALARLHSTGGIAIPDEDEQMRAVDTALSMLTAADYGQYETSNCARPGYECLHNLSCWRGLDYVGFGPSASSRAGLKRWTNLNDLAGYIGALSSGANPDHSAEEILSEIDDITERLIFNFRLTEGVALQKYISNANSPAQYWKTTLTSLTSEGLVLVRNDRWFLTAQGRLLADYVASELICVP